MKYYIFSIIVVITVLLSACNRNEVFYTEPDAMLEFSVDTLRFDTVFTELGSATRFVKAYNPYNRSIKISNISVESGSNTFFRFNVDGIPGNEAQDVEIAPNDSLYIFGEVTIDPDEPLSASPFVIEDYLVFETNGNTQRVLLQAFGQNANYIPSRFNKGEQALLSCDFGEITWDDPKPYVIYGILFIDECQLNIPAGTKIYVHGGIVRNEELGVYNDGYIITLQNGRLNIEGTAEEPVIIQGDRLEESFQEAAAQWTGIILGKGSKNNNIAFATVKNSRFGILVDSTATLNVKNSQFYNTLGGGLIGYHSNIEAENCLVYNNGGNSVQLLFGGDYEFNYCTFSSFGVDAEALALSNFWCFDPNCELAKEFPLNARFKNCIITGSKADEIVLADAQANTDFNYLFTNCIIREDELTDVEAYADFYDFCTNCIVMESSDTLFVDANEDDYHLDTLSIAEEMAMPIPAIDIDLEGNIRDAERPDIGCYEYQK